MQHHCLAGQVHYRMWRRLNESFGQLPEVGDLAPIFFISTADAHLNSALLILNRLIDRRRDALSIVRFLKRAAATAEAFPHSTPGKVREAVGEDLALLGTIEPSLTKMRVHRNEQFVHLSQALLKPPYGVIPAEDAFEYQDVLSVLVLIGEILNRYAGFLMNTEFLMEVWGEQDDFDYLLGILSRVVDRGGFPR